ncbi:MAG TPA: hypothetical protein VI699_08085, partial [Candidatus Acidoferrales bacterium]|nr:hypothetical protein [Candidatus Acidoferrales bacterium]
RRKTLHSDATEPLNSQWIVKQLQGGFPENLAPDYLVLKRDTKFAGEAINMSKSIASKPSRTA